MTKILGRDDLLAGTSLKRELVEIPELDGALWLRELSTSQLLKFNARVNELKAEKQEVDFETSLNLMSLVVSMSACDEGGNLLFTEADAARLADSRVNVLMTLSTKALQLSGMDIDLSEVIDNLKKVPTSLPSDSPPNSTRRKRK